MRLNHLILLLSIPICYAVYAADTPTATVSPASVTKKTPVKKKTVVHHHVAAAATTRVAARPAAAGVKAGVAAIPTRTTRTPTKKRWVQTWDEPTYKESTNGDSVDGEDLDVRRAAVEALGQYNGSIVAVDPTNGRILTMVNQHLALGAGFQPCSTIKVAVALAALREKVISRTLPIHLYGRTHMDLTNALAHSNNFYFANLGVKLGYETFSYYAHLFGYGEKAGLDIPGEQSGDFPAAPPKNGGMGMLTSFGEEIHQTPLELAALMSALANGGTMYYLQYPKNAEEMKNFTPLVKRHLDIGPLIGDIKPGMQGAVEFGTARRAKQDTMIYGKTGTCSEGRTRLGWFGSFNDVGKRKLVVVVMLTGGRPTIGPLAADVAGDVYRKLAAQKYFDTDMPLTPATLISSQICCSGK